ncbi:MAG: hypothetical protein V1704_00150 [Candidatus Vogelbacteria bacterium]
MLLIISISLIIFSSLAVLGLIILENQRPTNLPFTSQSASEILEPVIATTAHSLITAVRYIVRHLSIRFLVALHTLASFGRAVLTRIEKRFALLIDAVRGRGQTPSDRHRGSVSFFLEQIKDYKEEMTRRAKIR